MREIYWVVYICTTQLLEFVADLYVMMKTEIQSRPRIIWKDRVWRATEYVDTIWEDD